MAPGATVRRLLDSLRWRRVLRDRESDQAIRSLQAARAHRRDSAGAGEEPASEPVPVHVGLFGGQVLLRPGTSDVVVLEETVREPNHVPPRRRVPRNARRIWDLGANIGLVAAHYAMLYPSADILAVELDEENASLCRRNTDRWTGRCEVLEAAVWAEDGFVTYEVDPAREYGAHVAEHGRQVRAVSLNTLLAKHGSPVDFVKVDVEGAEATLLRTNTEWAAAVRCIKVEPHSPYSWSDCEADLRRLGFQTRVDRDRFSAVLGWR
jgi:FkbM family methyltransferase